MGATVKARWGERKTNPKTQLGDLRAARSWGWYPKGPLAHAGVRF